MPQLAAPLGSIIPMVSGGCRSRSRPQGRIRPVHLLGPKIVRILGQRLRPHEQGFRLTASSKRRGLEHIDPLLSE